MTATATITPPASSHGEGNHWGYEPKTFDHNGDEDYDPATDAFHDDRPRNFRKTSSGAEVGGSRWEHDPNVMSPPLGSDPKMENSYALESSSRARHSADENGRSSHHAQENEMQVDHSKWIHRDKLARIESEELQAAGIFLPKTRAPSKQRRDRDRDRDRSQSRLRRGTDASEQSHSRSRKNSLAVEQRNTESSSQNWDLRTPEEIAEEEAEAYFSNNGLKGGSRIPVAKTSPAPIPVDYLERAAPAARKTSESPEDGTILYTTKTRSRSASASARDADSTHLAVGTKPAGPDASPRKNANSRKSSGPKPAQGRPKTRSGRDSSANSGTRPSTRSGELSGTKPMEGDPPWIVSAYKPDPRLPPDQQLLPTVAKRLQQEKWEKEGKFGDVYDRDFRPLNDNAFLKPPEGEDKPATGTEGQQDEWPLRQQDAPKSPRAPGSYSTMPKISDKTAQSPVPSPRMQATPQMQKVPTHSTIPPAPAAQENTVEEKESKDGGCGCCVVM
ncbi:hypothetical protein B0I35DRAFT_412496 [Stachybotrys elegans]|uniref:TeaA receptor TeaR n=1 Tax=Stachybotrys elegans TaxID=80388 RepID=A0A8K0SHL8_9HYPO|nr:hypothetical protein B0I35DRAFT_412496 [Stachybotrys elegans]